MFGNQNRSDSKSSRLAREADRQSTETQDVPQVQGDIEQPVAPAGTYQESAADRLTCTTIPSLTAYSTLQHALQVRDDGSEYDMMASMAEDARMEDVFERWNDNVDTLVVFVVDHQVDFSSSSKRV